MLGKPESWSITLKGAINPTVHHPSWYHLIGQLSKDELASVVASKEISVTPASSGFRAPLFSVDKPAFRSDGVFVVVIRRITSKTRLTSSPELNDVAIGE